MNNFSGFLQLLKGPLEILSGNRKLIAFTATLYFIFNIISIVLYTYSSNPFIFDFVGSVLAILSARPGTPEYTQLLAAIRKDIGILVGIAVAYGVLNFFITLFTETAVIITASSHYNGDNLSIKELIVKVSRTWTRPFVTMFYIQLIYLGCISLFFYPFFVPTLVLYDHPIILITLLVFLAILLITFYVYLSVVWSLGVVVSVVEDSYGLSALGKARELVKGKRVHGFLLNFFLLLELVVIVVVGMKLSPFMPIVVGMIQYVCMCVVSLFQILAYSAFYFQCKNQTQKSVGFEYSQIPNAPVVHEDLA